MAYPRTASCLCAGSGHGRTNEQGVTQTHKAKARLVVKGFTYPALVSIRAESPTLSKVGRNTLHQLAACHKWSIGMGDVKTAFLRTNLGENERQIYGDLPADSRKLFGLIGRTAEARRFCVRAPSRA